MEVVVHLGPNKTGTTALQRTLSANRKALLRQGVLYPCLRSQEYHHNILVSGSKEIDKFPRLLAHYFRTAGETPTERFDSEVDCIREQVRRERPGIVVFSGENLFSDGAHTQLEFWREVIGQPLTGVRFVAYVRDPAGRVLSAAQQQLKHSSRFLVPRNPVKMKKVLQRLEETVPGNVVVRPYDREQLADGDITFDFLKTLAGHADWRKIKAKTANETMSPEAMWVLQSYRQIWHSNSDNIPKEDVKVLLRRLKQSGEIGAHAKKPELWPHVASAIRRSSGAELSWIAEQYGVKVRETGLESERGESGTVDDLRVDTEDVRSLCKVDEKAALQIALSLNQGGR